MGKRTTYLWDKETQKMVEIRQYGKREIETAPFIITDDIPPTESMATDKREIFTSKSQLKRHYKQHGYEITGGDHLTGKGIADFKPEKTDPKVIREAAEKAYYDIKYDRVPVSEKERQLFKEEDRKWTNYKNRRK